MLETRPNQHRSSASAHCVLAAALTAALTSFAFQASRAADSDIVKVAVFEFELDDKSAGGGIIAADAIDTENLKLSTEEARRMLVASGRYSIVDPGRTGNDVMAAGGLRNCNGCEAPLANTLGADQSMAGLFTRVNRTEYTLQIVVRDSRTGAAVSNVFTGLRMGANYSWPRGVKSLVGDKILAAQSAK